MSTDTSFFTNEPGFQLKDRFSKLVKGTELFDCLVGYFYSSGFYAVYPSLEDTDRIRILIGISTGSDTFKMIEQGNAPTSHAETKKTVEDLVQHEMELSEDTRSVQEVGKTWIQ